MRYTAYLCLLTCLLTLCPPWIQAQEVRRGDWNQVALLTARQRIELHPFSGKRLRGRFRSATPDAVSIDVEAGAISVNRSDVRVLKVRRGSGRLRNAGLGAAIGGGIAGGISIAALHGDLDDSLAMPIILVTAIIGAVAGFGVGMIPAAYNTIYEVHRP